MRLIDADAVSKKISEAFDMQDLYLPIHFITFIINEMPTVEECKTGKWLLDEDRSKVHVENIYICSACRNNEAWGETERTRYCSYCGAEMENRT